MEFKDYVGNLKRRLVDIENIFEKKEIVVSFDRFRKKERVDHELVYFRDGTKESSGFFVFGFSFFVKELEEQNFKRKLDNNSEVFKIYNAYKKAKKKNKVVSISDIVNFLHDKKKDSTEVNETISKILSLAYYLNWNIEKNKKDIEQDYIVEIPNRFLVRLKQRYNFDLISPVYENEDFFIFLNARCKLNVIFKDRDLFSKADVKRLVFPALRKTFELSRIIEER